LLVLAGGCSSPPGVSARDDMSTGGNGGGDGGTMALSIAPLTASLGFGQSLTFTANRPVSWSVVEPGAGVIDADGHYTAPFVPGTVHVHAATTDAPAEEATATVSVADHALTFVAGGYGGRGDADGTGTAARFEIVRGMAYDGARYVYLGDAGAVRRLDLTSNAVTTLAGRAIYWNGSVDAIGAAAKFGGAVWSVALDGKGALYVADTNNHTIRKLDLASRAVTTVAGLAGAAGFTNGAGGAARFNAPTGMAFDAAKARLYIGDANNGAIRVYDPASTQVTTLTSSLFQPDGLVFDGGGTLYVADAGSHQVWSVDTSTQAVTLLAGAGRGFRDGVGPLAHFDAPSPIALEGGALFVGDTLGLRKVDLSSKQVSTVPVRGGDARMLTGALGDGQGHVLAFAGSDAAILKVAAATGATSVVAGPDGLGLGNVDAIGAAARFFDPGDLVATPAGALYVSDASNSEVRRVDLSTAMVATVVGTPAQDDTDGVGRQARMYYPTSLASDHAGAIYVVEPNSSTIRKWVAATNTLTTLAGSRNLPGSADGVGAAARFNTPMAACADGGALYVSDQLNHTIRKITVASGTVETLAGTAEEPGAADGVGPAARFNQPAGLACDGAGYVYVADVGNYAIRRIELASKTVDTVAGALGAKGEVDLPGAAARFTAPGEMTFAGGFLYVIDNGYVNLHVRKIQLGTWNVQTIAISTLSGQEFYGLAVDGSGVVYVSDKEFGNSTVATVAANGTLTPFAGSNATGNGLVIDGAGTAANFFGAAGMVYDGSALFVAEPQAMVVRRIDPATAMVTSAFGVSPDSPNVGGTGGNAFVAQPAGLALVDASTLFVADSSSLDKVTLPGASLTVAAGAVGYSSAVDGIGTAARLYARGMVYDGAGTIYFAGANTVRRYVVASGQVDTIAGLETTTGSTDGTGSAARFYWPQGLAADGAGNLYVSDTRNHTIRKLVIATGEVSTFAGTATMFGGADGVGASARFALPMGIVGDGKGSLFVADSENGAIRRIEIATRAVTTYVGVLGERGLQSGALPAHLNTPRGLALLPDGGLAVTDEQAVLVVH
jgi:sugar lactone lactonase YvrE